MIETSPLGSTLGRSLAPRGLRLALLLGLSIPVAISADDRPPATTPAAKSAPAAQVPDALSMGHFRTPRDSEDPEPASRPSPVRPGSPEGVSASDGRTAIVATAHGQELDSTVYPFHVVIADPRHLGFYSVGCFGEECTNPFLDRGIILSEDQSRYPEPASGCGPTAILNWLIWYQNTGLIPRSTRDSDENEYKIVTLRLIDQKICALKGHLRTAKDGANTTETIVVFDALMRELSKGQIRMDARVKAAPLAYQDLQEQSRGYRAGILVVQLFDTRNPPTGGFHAVAVVRTDARGTVSLANWGTYEIGRLVNKPDGQWFVPDDGEPPTMRLVQLITLVPFRPKSR